MVTPATDAARPKGTVKKAVFNLDTMAKETVEVQYEIPVPLTVEQLTQIDSKDLLEAWNKYQERQAKVTAKAGISGADPGVINSFIRGYRILPMFFVGADGQRLTDEKGAKITRLNDAVQERIDKKAQTAAIWAHIKSNPAMLESLKEAAQNAQGSEGEGETDEEDDN